MKTASAVFCPESPKHKDDHIPKGYSKDARQAGDGDAVSNLERALSLNSRVFRKTTDQRKRSEREQRRQEQRTRPSSPPRQQTVPSKVIRLEYAGGSVDMNIRQSDEGKLLRALQIAGGRAL